MAWVAAVVCGILLVASCAHTAPSYYASQLSKHRPLGQANHTRPLPGAGTYGVDVSTLVSESDFTCLKANGFEFAIVRGFQSNGEGICLIHTSSPRSFYICFYVV